jgi:hypothetical protein
LKLDKAIVVRNMAIMILFSRLKFLGVFLSPRAFLKSLITLLNEKDWLVADETDPEAEN